MSTAENEKSLGQEVWYIDFSTEPGMFNFSLPRVRSGIVKKYTVKENGQKKLIEKQARAGTTDVHLLIAWDVLQAFQQNPNLAFRLRKDTPQWLIDSFYGVLREMIQDHNLGSSST